MAGVESLLSGSAMPGLARVQSLGAQSSHAFASALGASLSRNQTPDPQHVMTRSPSPCPPGMGGRSGVTLDPSKPFAKAEETSLRSVDILQMKSSGSTSATTHRIYGSTPLAVSVAGSRDISGSQSTTPVTELSDTKKSSMLQLRICQ
jgi:hypothetical protein